MDFVKAWKSYDASFWHIQTLKRGLACEFTTKPPLSLQPIPFEISNPEKRAVLQEHILLMCQKGAIETVSDPMTPGYYSIIFLRPKKSGELRPIIDLFSLNHHIFTPSFKMESAQSVRSALTQGQWIASVDLRDAYFHIPIRKSYRKYLRFATENQVWQIRALPFGLSVAPAVFTRVMSLVGIVCHQHGIKIHL